MHSKLLSPKHYGAPSGTSNLEGFLFPATYELTAGAPVQRLVDEQLRAFRTLHGRGLPPRAGAARDALPAADGRIDDRARGADGARPPADRRGDLQPPERRHPAGDRRDDLLAVELQKGIATYTGELTESQLKIDSPYNSRTHKGLPPTPISNPGEASINAAAHPSHVPYLYYVAGADGCGEQVFSKTYAEFEKNVAAYDAAVKKNGGHPPACKKK